MRWECCDDDGGGDGGGAVGADDGADVWPDHYRVWGGDHLAYVAHAQEAQAPPEFCQDLAALKARLEQFSRPHQVSDEPPFRFHL